MRLNGLCFANCDLAGNSIPHQRVENHDNRVIVQGKAAEAFMERNKDKKFFLYFPIFGPHLPRIELDDPYYKNVPKQDYPHYNEAQDDVCPRCFECRDVPVFDSDRRLLRTSSRAWTFDHDLLGHGRGREVTGPPSSSSRCCRRSRRCLRHASQSHQPGTSPRTGSGAGGKRFLAEGSFSLAGWDD